MKDTPALPEGFIRSESFTGDQIEEMFRGVASEGDAIALLDKLAGVDATKVREPFGPLPVPTDLSPQLQDKIVRLAERVPPGYQLTPEALGRLYQLDQASCRNERRLLLKFFAKKPIKTYEPIPGASRDPDNEPLVFSKDDPE